MRLGHNLPDNEQQSVFFGRLKLRGWDSCPGAPGNGRARNRFAPAAHRRAHWRYTRASSSVQWCSTLVQPSRFSLLAAIRSCVQSSISAASHTVRLGPSAIRRGKFPCFSILQRWDLLYGTRASTSGKRNNLRWSGVSIFDLLAADGVATETIRLEKMRGI